MAKDLKPTLYHATPIPCTGTAIEPRHSYTLLHKEDPANHIGDFVFATPSLLLAYAYALRLRDYSRMSSHPSLGDGPYGYVRDINPIQLQLNENGSYRDVPFMIVDDKEKYLSELSTCHPTIYRLPRENFFKPVKSATSAVITGEWISTKPVLLARCAESEFAGIEDAMRKGIQVFFIKDISALDLIKEVNIIRGEISASINLKHPDLSKEDFLHMHQRLQATQMMPILIGKGFLEHYNVEKNICPLNLESGKFDPGNEPEKLAAGNVRGGITPKR